jgi:hypothetical protein
VIAVALFDLFSHLLRHAIQFGFVKIRNLISLLLKTLTIAAWRKHRSMGKVEADVAE